MLPIPFNNPATYAGHSGVDYPVPRGTPIPASGPGRVTSLSRNAAGGFYIWIKYDEITPEVGYHHMDSHAGCPAVGSRVSEGTQLGYVGSTGNSTGPHLHSEVAGHRTTAGYWQFFDRTRVVGTSASGSSAGGSMITPEMENEEMPISYINVPGEAGKRRGGCYAVMRDNNGKLFARFVEPKPMAGAPTIQNGRALSDWDATFGSMPGLK